LQTLTVRTLVTTAILASMFGGPKIPKEHKESYKAIQASYEKMAKAFADADTTAILALRDTACFVEFPNGAVNDYAAMAGDLRNFFVLNHKPIKVKYTLKDTKFVAADSAIVTCFQEASRYQDLAGKKREVKHDATQDEIWVKRVDGWKIRAIGNIRDRHRWVDGKAVDPTKPYDPAAKEYKPEKS
jgi:hypothetical protein